MSRRTFVFITCVTLATLAVLFVVFFNSLSTHDIGTDPLKYKSYLGAFRTEHITLLPTSIPADALIKYEARGGLGPSSHRLSVSYRTDPADAAQLLATARKRAFALDRQMDVGEHEAEAVAGDETVRIAIDPETGVVSFIITHN